MFFITLAAIENENERLKIADVYKKYRYKALHIAMGITRNRQEAEDAVQDTFIDIIKYKEKVFSMDCNLLPSYIAVIVKHKAINIMRKNKRITDTSFEEIEAVTESPEPSVEESVIGKLGFERLIALAGSLDEKYKTVFEMKYVLGFSIKEISERLGESEGNVKTRLFRAREKMKRQLTVDN